MNFPNAKPLPVQRELRLLITPTEARFQIRDPEGPEPAWHNLTDPELEKLLELERANALRLPLASSLIFSSATRWLRDRDPTDHPP